MNSKQEAITAWNTRASEARIAQLEGALENAATWLEACLSCANFHWDGDQHEAASLDLAAARTALNAGGGDE